MHALRPRAFAGIAAVVFLLLGCAGLQGASPPRNPPPGLAASPCTPGTCTITVTVNGNCQSPSDITVDKPLAVVNSAVNLRWVISPATFSFASNGIQFDPADPQFEVKNSPRPNEFHVQNHRRSTGDFYYFINIQGCARADPWIRNS